MGDVLVDSSFLVALNNLNDKNRPAALRYIISKRDPPRPCDHAAVQRQQLRSGRLLLAERLNITQILTFDRRDFSVFRPAHTPYFDLLP